MVLYIIIKLLQAMKRFYLKNLIVYLTETFFNKNKFPYELIRGHEVYQWVVLWKYKSPRHKYFLNARVGANGLCTKAVFSNQFITQIHFVYAILIKSSLQKTIRQLVLIKNH